MCTPREQQFENDSGKEKKKCEPTEMPAYKVVSLLLLLLLLEHGQAS